MVWNLSLLTSTINDDCEVWRGARETKDLARGSDVREPAADSGMRLMVRMLSEETGSVGALKAITGKATRWCFSVVGRGYDSHRSCSGYDHFGLVSALPDTPAPPINDLQLVSLGDSVLMSIVSSRRIPIFAAHQTNNVVDTRMVVRTPCD